MTLGTADEDGRPWASPVYYAAAGYTAFLWVSSPQARHSRNLAARPQLSIVIFDSGVPPGSGQGVYMDATAEQLTGADLDRGIQLFSRRSQADDGSEWTREDSTPPAKHRLYRAVVTAQWVLDDHDERVPVSLGA